MSFTVDQVGKPVLVKTSYFPNWRADGAEGPYRVAPNLMVVVPTQKNVSLSYGRSGVEWLGMALSLAGVVIVVLLLVVRTPRFPRAWQFAGDAEPGDPTRVRRSLRRDTACFGGTSGFSRESAGPIRSARSTARRRPPVTGR